MEQQLGQQQVEPEAPRAGVGPGHFDLDDFCRHGWALIGRL